MCNELRLDINIVVLQVVYNAKSLAKLVKEKEKCLNKIEYLQKRRATNQLSKQPTIRASGTTLGKMDLVV
jgi:hypothetical protein